MLIFILGVFFGVICTLLLSAIVLAMKEDYYKDKPIEKEHENDDGRKEEWMFQEYSNKRRR